MATSCVNAGRGFADTTRGKSCLYLIASLNVSCSARPKKCASAASSGFAGTTAGVATSSFSSATARGQTHERRTSTKDTGRTDMPYYNTIEEDLKRAKEILAEGKNEMEVGTAITDGGGRILSTGGGTIYGKDTYAAYKLLESFVEIIEAMDPKVIKTVMRAQEIAERHRRLLPDAVAAARRMHADGATHDCFEWRTDQGLCALCDRRVTS